jgi:uncharacterized protein involved in response to NO
LAEAYPAGFLLTAVPQLTGRTPLQGPGLAALAGTWLLVRLAMLGRAPLGRWEPWPRIRSFR